MKLLFLALCSLLPMPVWAQAADGDDAPIPYEDDDDAGRPKKTKKIRTRIREEDEGEAFGEQPLIGRDDPNVGLSIEGLVGAMMLDSSRGALAETRFMGGARFTWEFGRLIPDEYLREMFFADLTWQYAMTSEGTAQINDTMHSSSFTLAPALAFPFGKSHFAGYLQLGAGVNYVESKLRVYKDETTIAGTKFLFQYGAGIRARIPITDDGGIRLSFRIEVTRFVRGYMHDMFLGGGAGLTF
jgi:hypothetical protein